MNIKMSEKQNKEYLELIKKGLTEDQAFSLVTLKHDLKPSSQPIKTFPEK